MEFLVLVRPDFLTSLLCIVQKSLLMFIKAPKDIRLDWTSTEGLLPVSVALPRIYLGEINLLVVMPRPWLLFMISLG